MEPLGFSVARWVSGGWSELEKLGRIFNCKTVRDAWDRPVLLFKNDWNLNQLIEDHPDEWSRYSTGDDGDVKKMAGFFTGKIMKATRGQADGKVVAKLLADRAASS